MACWQGTAAPAWLWLPPPEPDPTPPWPCVGVEGWQVPLRPKRGKPP